MKKWIAGVVMALLFGGGASMLPAQDSVDVTFRYNRPAGAGAPFLVGELNGWNNAIWPMTDVGGNLYVRTARVAVGGQPGGGIPGAYQYKFYTGSNPWPNDPLNHHVNPNDNDNTYLYIRNPTIYHLLPNQRSGTVTTNFPTISAFLFPRVGTVVDTASLSLSVAGTTYSGIGRSYDFATKAFSFTLPTSLPNGSHTVILRAGASADTVNFIIQVGSPPIAPLPSYAAHGVTLPSPVSNDSTTFRLRVPTDYSILRVAPAGQPVSSGSAYFMRKDPSTNNWWMNVALSPGTYEYQYQVGSGAVINDPWGRYNGTFGTRFTIGPEGLTADDYVWRSTAYSRPPLNKLVIYELNIGEFAGGYFGLGGGQAGFTHLSQLMRYFDSLGVNALELMPVNDYGNIGRSGFSWGYDVSHHFALEPAYGTPRQFKALVDSAHAHGIAIIVDAVFNHLNDPGPLWQMLPREYDNPYFKLCNDRRYNEDQLCFFRDMDHWTPETQEYFLEVLKMFIDKYRVDGFRYDFTQGVGWNVAEPSKGILGWANRIDTLYQGRVYQIAEHLPESPALIYYSGLTGGWHDSFRDEVFDEARFRNRTLDRIENLVLDVGAYPGNDTPAQPGVYANRTEPVNATVNHDEQSLIYEMVQFQGVPLAEAIQRDKLYAPFMFASVGIPMLWEGMEFSEPRGWPSDGQKLNYRPVQFSLLQTDRGRQHFQWYSKLIRQRLRNPALFQGNFRRIYRYDAQKTLVWGFEDPVTGAKVMAVSNLSGSEQTVTNIPWLGNGRYFDILDQSVLTVTGLNVASFTIPAYTARLFSSLSDSVLNDVHNGVLQQLPKDIVLEQNYPNPFNPATTLRYQLPQGASITLKLYDVLGKEVATLVDGAVSAGVHEAVWDGRNDAGVQVGSGVYFYRLTVNGGGGANGVQMKKMLFLK